MTLEELIYKRFAGSEALANKLASFGGLPAVFSPEPPDRCQGGWGCGPQYPMAVYSFDLQANEERHSAGTLSVSLLCQNTDGVTPEAIEPLVRSCLRDVVLKPEGGTPYCFAWARTDAFTIEDKKAGATIGSEVRFDILEYPSQETSDPDPVMAVNRSIKGMVPGGGVMGYDRRPVVYCRLVSVDKAQETNTVAWMDGKVAIHILCPDSVVRMKMAAAIANSMSLDGEVIMLDNSPMFIKRLQANYKSDYLKDGQVFVTGHYGLLRYRAKPHPFAAAHVKYK